MVPHWWMHGNRNPTVIRSAIGIANRRSSRCGDTVNNPIAAHRGLQAKERGQRTRSGSAWRIAPAMG